MSMSAGVAGSRRRWDKDIVAQTNATIAGELSGAPITRPIRTNIQSGATIGALTGDALAAGDLSTFVSIDCLIYGKVYGFGGAASSGAGGHAISGNNQSNLTINLESGGEIRGGGGGGGNGGLGGYGTRVNSWSAEYYDDNPKYYHVWNSDWYWNNTMVMDYSNYNEGLGWHKYSGYVYYMGSEWPPVGYNTIKRGAPSTGTKGAGGTGGTGQGYNQSAVSGGAGSSGTNNAGSGGWGGSGASWAAIGSTGNTGYTGYYYDTAPYGWASGENWALTPAGGSAGSSGGAAGKAAYNMTGVTLNNNGGTISGATS